MNNLIEIYTGLTKAQISAFVKDTAKVVTDNGNILETLAQLKAMETIATGLKNALKSEALTEIEKHGVNTLEMSGIEFTISRRKTWDFKTDSKYMDLSEQLKERETMLKSLTEPVVDMDGEIIGLPSWTESESISIKLPK